MNIRVNGEVIAVSSGVTVQALLAQLGIIVNRAVVEYNGAILPQQEWPSVSLREHDSLEIVSFVGGG
ncbi:MAG: sulfur carrier protein ThiS [Candidatus Omnitrophica bacterium]|nr:sulfur carrier protein ThiS [Candidatus Omnitrophota bacterium]